MQANPQFNTSTVANENFDHGRLERMWPKLKWILLIFAILIYFPREFFLRSGGSDHFFQISAAQSLLGGHGYTIPTADPNDLSKTIYSYLSVWPPLFSLIYAPLYKLFGVIWLPMVIVNLISVIVFFVSWLFILEMLGKHLTSVAKLALWSFWILAYSPLYNSFTDSQAVALFAASIAVILAAIKHPRLLFQLTIVSGLLMGTAALSRYMYWALLSVIPLTLFIVGVRRNRRLIWAAIAHAATSGIILLGLILWQRAAEGNQVSHVAEITDLKGIFLSQLSRAIPFPVGSLGLLDIQSILEKRGLQNTDFITLFFWITSAFIVGVLVYQLIRVFRIKGEGDEVIAEEGFYTIGVATLLCIVGLLGYLTIRTKAVGWVPIEEFRYYNPIAPFFTVAIVATLFDRQRIVEGSRLRMASKAILGGLLGVAIILGAYRQFNVLREIRPAFKDEDRLGENSRLFYRLVQSELKAGRRVVWITGNDGGVTYTYGASTMSGARGYHGPLTPHMRLRAIVPIVVFVGIPDEIYPDKAELSSITSLCQTYRCRPVGNLEHLQIMRFDLLPDQRRDDEIF